MKKVILNIIIVILICTLFYSGYHIVVWYLDNKKTDNLITDVKDEVKKEDSKTNNITYDFNKLKSINDETVAWINIPNTNVDYPIVKHKDNSFYLNHSFDKSHNISGWLFMDYRNNNDFTDKNTIIYAHGMLNGTMFGSLRNLLKLDDLKNTSINIYTEKGLIEYKIFSIYKIPTTDDYLKISFENNEFTNFIDLIGPRSEKYLDETVNEKDTILTLSTCYDETEKLVIHAKKNN